MINSHIIYRRKKNLCTFCILPIIKFFSPLLKRGRNHINFTCLEGIHNCINIRHYSNIDSIIHYIFFIPIGITLFKSEVRIMVPFCELVWTTTHNCIGLCTEGLAILFYNVLSLREHYSEWKKFHKV